MISEKLTGVNRVDIKLEAGQLEGTSARLSGWLVESGSYVEQGVPVAELETDKVAMEICAPATGIVCSINASPGDEINSDQVIGKIEVELARGNLAERVHKQSDSRLEHSNNEYLENTQLENTQLGSAHIDAHHLVSPAVRRLLRDNNISMRAIFNLIEGSGRGHRITRDDVLSYIQSQSAIANSTTQSQCDENRNKSNQHIERLLSRRIKSRKLKGRLVEHSTMRRSIASHMVDSLLKTSPHVTSIFEMDMSNVIEHCRWHKKEMEAEGVKLTLTAYFLAAMVKAVEAVPEVNARFHQQALEVFSEVNIGLATSLGRSGIVVPVIEQVQTMSLFDIARETGLQTEKARSGRLKTDDINNGSITLSNYGVSGSLVATPIVINQPQVAILGVGKLEKRVVVELINGVDTMVIRPRCYVSLSIDHRALDGWHANQFLTVFVKCIEDWE